MNLSPIPSGRLGSASRFKGVYKSGKKWKAQIRIPSEVERVYLGIFDSEEEAGIMYARARYKYPVEEQDYSYLTKPCPLDLIGVPMNLAPSRQIELAHPRGSRESRRVGRNGRR